MNKIARALAISGMVGLVQAQMAWSDPTSQGIAERERLDATVRLQSDAPNRFTIIVAPGEARIVYTSRLVGQNDEGAAQIWANLPNILICHDTHPYWKSGDVTLQMRTTSIHPSETYAVERGDCMIAKAGEIVVKQAEDAANRFSDEDLGSSSPDARIEVTFLD